MGAVEKPVGGILSKLRVTPSESDHPCVLAVRTYLSAADPDSEPPRSQRWQRTMELNGACGVRKLDHASKDCDLQRDRVYAPPYALVAGTRELTGLEVLAEASPRTEPVAKLRFRL